MAHPNLLSDADATIRELVVYAGEHVKANLGFSESSHSGPHPNPCTTTRPVQASPSTPARGPYAVDTTPLAPDLKLRVRTIIRCQLRGMYANADEARRGLRREIMEDGNGQTYTLQQRRDSGIRAESLCASTSLLTRVALASLVRSHWVYLVRSRGIHAMFGW